MSDEESKELEKQIKQRRMELEREALCRVINENAAKRTRLETLYGKVWDTEEAIKEFQFLSFAAPFARVQRRATGEELWLCFQHSPRYYWLANKL